MAEETKVFTEYLQIPEETLYNEDMIDSMEGSQLVNNALLTYAQTRRVHQTVHSQFQTDGFKNIIWLPLTAEKGGVALTLPLDGIATGAGRNIRVYAHIKTSVNTPVNMYLKVGRNSGKTESVESLTYHWVTVDCPIDPIKGVDLKTPLNLVLYFGAVSADTYVGIDSISIYETEALNVPTFTDLSGADNKVGVVDFPFSSAMVKLLNDNLTAIYRARLPRANIYNRAYIDNYFVLTGAYQEVGRWVIKKSRGFTDLSAKVHSITAGAGGTCRIKIETYIVGGGLYSTNTVDQTAGAGSEWNDIALASVHTDQTEYEIVLSVKEQTATASTILIDNIYIYEDMDGGAEVAHTLPSKKDTQQEDDLLAKQWNYVKTTAEQTWKRQRQVVLNDYFYGFAAKLSNYQQNAPLAIGAFLPSYGSKQLHCRCRFSKPPKVGAFKLDYDGQTVNFTYSKGDAVKTVVVGATSKATGVIEYDDDAGATGTLYLTSVVGEFIDNETINGTSGGIAVVNGVLESFDLSVYLKFGIYSTRPTSYGTIAADAAVVVDVKDYADNEAFDMDFSIPIPEDWYNGEQASGDPWMFAIETACDISGVALATWKPVDYVQIHYIKIYEEIEGIL